MSGPFEYDVLLSHSVEDRPQVRQDLKGVGHGT